MEAATPTRTAPRPNASTQFRGLGREAGDILEFTRGLVAYNAVYVALAWIVALGAIAVYWALPAWYTFALAFVVVSSRQQALLNCEHEAVHRKLFPSLRVNNFIGRYLCAAPVGSPFGAAQARHLVHHRLLATPEDPDRELHAGEDKSTRRGLVRYFLNGLLGGYAGMILMGPRAPQAAARAGSPRHDLVSLAVAQGVIFAGLTLTTSWWVYFALWAAPLASLTACCHLIRSFVEHAISETEARAHSNRLITIRSTWLERALLSPYFMNYHAEHHLLPSVPAPRLHELQERLARRDDLPPVLVRSSYGGALKRYSRELPH